MRKINPLVDYFSAGIGIAVNSQKSRDKKCVIIGVVELPP